MNRAVMNAAGVPDWFLAQAARGCGQEPSGYSTPGDAIRLGGTMAAVETPDYDPDRDGYIWDPDRGPHFRRQGGSGCRG